MLYDIHNIRWFIAYINIKLIATLVASYVARYTITSKQTIAPQNYKTFDLIMPSSMNIIYTTTHTAHNESYNYFMQYILST